MALTFEVHVKPLPDARARNSTAQRKAHTAAGKRQTAKNKDSLPPRHRRINGEPDALPTSKRLREEHYTVKIEFAGIARRSKKTAKTGTDCSNCKKSAKKDSKLPEKKELLGGLVQAERCRDAVGGKEVQHMTARKRPGRLEAVFNKCKSVMGDVKEGSRQYMRGSIKATSHREKEWLKIKDD